MSLCIDVDKVAAVLLADGWHTVAGKSFITDTYEFLWKDEWAAGDGMGAEWTEETGKKLFCPLSSILGVRY